MNLRNMMGALAGTCRLCGWNSPQDLQEGSKPPGPDAKERSAGNQQNGRSRHQRPPGCREPPQGRVEGRTREHSFDLPWPRNPGSSPRKKPIQTRHQKSTTVKTTRKATPKSRQEYERQRSTTQEHREQQRLRAREQRRRAKERGLCVNCGEPAIPDQTRCPTCAEKHRVDRRRWQAERRNKTKETST